MISTSAPSATTEQATDLRKDLEASGWGVDAVTHVIGEVAQAALGRETRLPALLALRAALAADQAAGASPSPVALLTALFMLGEPVLAADLDSVLLRTRTRGASAMGLVSEPDGQGLVRAMVDLRPHESVDSKGHVRWWVASDLPEVASGRALEPDHVLGIGGASMTLASLTPRTPVVTALDLGCGCGIQTLYLLRHAQRVTATDVSRRALAFTAFNASLAGTEDGCLELLEGSFLEPVAGRCFDLIAANPPFVITPPAVRAAGLPLMEYRDAGGPVLPVLVPRLGEHLSPDGVVVMLGNWELYGAEGWRERVGAWLPADVDAWVIQRETQDPVEYATMWLRDGGQSPERDREVFETVLGAWIADFQVRGVREVGFGYLILHRPAAGEGRDPWRVLEEVATQPAGSLGAHVAESVAARSGLAQMSDDAVAALYPTVAPDVTEERYLRPGQSEPSVILLRQGGAFARTCEVGTALAALVGVADGDLSIAQVAGAVAVLTETSVEVLVEEMVAGARTLTADGFLTLAKGEG